MSSLLSEFQLDLHLVKRLANLDFANPVSLELSFPKALCFTILPDDKLVIIFSENLDLCRDGLLSSAESVIRSSRNCQDPITTVSEALAIFIQTKKGFAFNFSKMPLTTSDIEISTTPLSLQIETFPAFNPCSHSSDTPTIFVALPEIPIGINPLKKINNTGLATLVLTTETRSETPQMTRADRLKYLESRTINTRSENPGERNHRRH